MAGKKRGEFELQFNWIFVFVVGVLILTLAVGFVSNQRKTSDALVSFEFVKTLRTIVSHSLNTPGETNIESLQKGIEFSCDPGTCSELGCTSDFFVRPRSLNAFEPTTTEVIFSPLVVDGKEIMTWSLEWDMPFHVNNFLFVTGTNVRYIFVRTFDSQSPHPDREARDRFVQEIYDGLPESMKNKEILDYSALDTIENKNTKVRLVFFYDKTPVVPGNLRGISNRDMSAVVIDPGTSSVEFYEKSGESFSLVPNSRLNYMDSPTIYGAVFSGNRDLYECNMKKALARLGVASQLYSKKVSFVSSSQETKSYCKDIYNQVSSLIDLPDGIIGLRSLENGQQLLGKVSAIAEKNNALKFRSCPVIY